MVMLLAWVLLMMRKAIAMKTRTGAWHTDGYAIGVGVADDAQGNCYEDRDRRVSGNAPLQCIREMRLQ